MVSFKIYRAIGPVQPKNFVLQALSKKLPGSAAPVR